MSTRYNLTVMQQRHLRLVCKSTGLSFPAMAARPKIALELIRDNLTQAMVNADCKARNITVTPKMLRREKMQAERKYNGLLRTPV